MNNVLIGGGTGFIGRSLAKFLKQNGINSTIITRYPKIHGGISWTDVEQNGIPKGFQGVVNLAGANLVDFTKNWKRGYKNEVFKSRIETTKILANAISVKKSEHDVKVFIQNSAVGYYPPKENAEYDEDSPGDSRADIFTDLCCRWEKAGEFPVDCDVRRVILRFGLVLGRDGGTIRSLYWPFYFGAGGPVGHGRQWFPWIHVDDLCRLYLYVLTHDNVSGTFNAVAPQNVTNAEFSKAFAQAMHRPAMLGTPSFVIKTLYDPDRAYLILTGQKVKPKRTLESGFVFDYPDIKKACKNLVG